MRAFTKKDFPVSKIRRFLEPGPIVLVSSAWKGQTKGSITAADAHHC